MKKLKNILMFLVVCAIICPAAILVGCSKQFTITVVVAEGNGSVKQINSLTHIPKNLEGKNEVKEGEKFEYAVAPADENYYIKYIKVDGKNIDFTVDKDGIARPVILNVKSNHEIVVAFARKTYSLSYYYYSQADDDYLPLMVNGSQYKTDVLFGWNVTITGFKDFGFTLKEGDTFIPFEVSGDTFSIHDNYNLYTTKSLDELKQLLGIA